MKQNNKREMEPIPYNWYCEKTKVSVNTARVKGWENIKISLGNAYQ